MTRIRTIDTCPLPSSWGVQYLQTESLQILRWKRCAALKIEIKSEMCDLCVGLVAKESKTLS